MKILLITHSQDNHSVDLVTESLSRRGATVLRLDSDYYPGDLRYSSLQTAAGRQRFIGTGERRMGLDDLDSVWYRRFFAGTRLSAEELGDTYEACFKESQMTLLGHLRSLDCFQMDPLHCVRRADYKEVQLAEAAKLGIRCPATLISNDPDAVRTFLAEVDAPVVTKMQSQFAIYREGEENVVFTSRVTEDNLSSLDGLSCSPMIFQEMVPKHLELRVTVVGHKVFAASIDSQKSEGAKVDWRREGNRLAQSWKPFEFPEQEAQKLLKLASWFGLNYAATDYILTPEGEFVFLELNAAGEWLWLQLYAGLDVASALAAVLFDPAARRVSEGCA